MKIGKVSCEQFAGIQDKSLSFSDGLNIILGDNETGKSTVVDLLFFLLFKDASLDGRADSDFIDKYFPKRVSGAQGNFIDGVIEFETENGIYKVSKEWSKLDPSSKITFPDGTSIKGDEKVAKSLRDELGFGAGVFGEIVFPSQKRQQNALESILSSSSKKKDIMETKESMSSTLTQAALETGGVSIEKLEHKISERIGLLGGHWDFATNQPEGGTKRGINNPWKRDVGQILAVFYEMETVRKKQEDAENIEKAIENKKNEIKTLRMRKSVAEGNREKFLEYKSIIERRNSLLELRQNQQNLIDEMSKALEKWPEIQENISKAETLRIKQTQAIIRDLYTKIFPAYSALKDVTECVEKLVPIKKEDVIRARNLQRDLDREQRKLSGMDIAATIKQISDIPIEVRSASEGTILAEENGIYEIHEAIEITIPGVAEMQFAPKGVSIEEVKANIASALNEIEAIFKQYGVSSVEELEEKQEFYSSKLSEKQQAENKYQAVLGDHNWDTIVAKNTALGDAEIASLADVSLMVIGLCGNMTLDEYIGSQNGNAAAYEEKYQSITNLGEQIKLSKEKLERIEKDISAIEVIPEEYANIASPEEHAKALKDAVDLYDSQISSCGNTLLEYEKEQGNITAEEYAEMVEVKENEFAKLKQEYSHWVHIADAFSRTKDKLVGNPVEDIETKFAEYIDVISDGGIKLQSMDEQLTSALSSKNHSLTYGILSDGTKDTLSLAFRLAMLEHLYPEGGGLAVFDDPFTDMDPKREKQACQLVQKFAEKNQVIFVTCDDKYKSLLHGNVIES